MTSRSRSRSRSRSQDYWPGFVDAMAALLVVIIFLLVVFVLAQVFLSQALSGRDEALQRLTSQVNELTELLALERQGNADLRLNVAQLSSSLQSANEDRDNLVVELSDMRSESTRLDEAVTLLTRRAETAERNLATANDTVEHDRETIRTQLSDMQRLQRDIDALRTVRAELEARVGTLVTALDASKSEAETLTAQSEDLESTLEKNQQIVGTLRNTQRELQNRVADQEERTLLAQQELRKRDIRLAELQALYLARGAALGEEQELSAEAKNRVSRLNQQIALLRQQLAALQGTLDQAESRDEEQQVVISDLGRRLNLALAQKVEELSRYRSEFFGRLREVLGDRRDVQIVGDRFVFQSEVLFSSGSAELGSEGRARLRDLANTLAEITPRIPGDINWILRVDGHTDSVPINSAQFPSNWELSGARATNVVKFLIEAGIPARRLAAAGFGQYHPLDGGTDEIAFRRNRRIEMKLTER